MTPGGPVVSASRRDAVQFASPAAPLLLTLLVAGTALCLSGCGGIGGNSPLPVAGTVTLNGEPLANADIVFTPQVPAEEEERSPRRARITQGTFALPAATGLLEGEYDVTIVRAEPEIEEVMAAEKAGLPSPLDSTPLPAGCQQPGMLTATIGPDGATDLKFELTSASR